MQYYDFSGKSIYCNCDNPHHSNFYKYFKDNFQKLNITHLYCTGYNKDGNGYYAEYNGTDEIIKPLNDNGDFRNEECINILKIADVIVTNPPFSLFRDYVKQLMDYNKKFLVIGSQNAITYKEIFPYIKNNELWMGMNWIKDFVQPNREIKKFGNICWFTNIPCINTKQPLILTKTYNPDNYPHYDNYDAINVDKVKDIPIDYDGVMGVPITFLQYYNPKQFEIVGMCENEDLYSLKTKKYTSEECKNAYYVKFNKKGVYDLNASGVLNKNGRLEKCYSRILIKKNDSLEPVEFEIVDINPHFYSIVSQGLPKPKQLKISGKPTYARILIKRI